MTYELLYAEGGHCGPYSNIPDALADAQRKVLGVPRSNHIEVHRRGLGMFGSDTRIAKVAISRPENILTISLWRKSFWEEIDVFQA